MKDRSYRLGICIASLSGAAALAHEVLWTRRMIDLIGATADSAARVIGCFFLGLSLGGILAAWLARRTRSPWRCLAIIELGVAILAIPALTLPLWSVDIWPWLGPEALVSWRGGTIKLGISVLIIVPPAVLMGMTLPMLGRAILRGSTTLGRHGIWLYSLNTLGGVFGLVLAVNFGLAWWGVSGTMAVAMIGNVVAAALCYVGHLRSPREQWHDGHGAVAEHGSAESPRPQRMMAVFACAFCSGATLLGLEMLAVQLFSHVVPSALQSTTAVLGIVILSLAVGAGLTPWFVAKAGSPCRLLSLLCLAAGLACIGGPWAFYWITDGLRLLETDGGPWWFMARLAGYVTCSIGPALLLGGMVFPTTQAWLSESDAQGIHWGWLLAASGMGGIVGVELAQRVLMLWFGMYGSVVVIGLCYLLLSSWLSGFLVSRRGRIALRSALAISAALVILMFNSVRHLPALPRAHREQGYTPIAVYTGRDGTLVVARSEVAGLSMHLPGGYTLGSSRARLFERRQAHLPLILHPRPQRVGLIAQATGIPAGATTMHNAVESVTVVELSRQVALAAAEHFSGPNRDVAKDPRVRLVVEDGRTYLAACQNDFDVVIGDFFLPWRTGTGRLHSIEHYLAVRSALRPGGMFCQWLPLYDMGREQADMIIATFARVFPNSHLIRGSFGPNGAVALLGFHDSDLDWKGLSDRCRQARQDGIVRDLMVLDPRALETLYLGRVTPGATNETTINTLGNAEMELSAGRLRMSGGWRDLLIRNENWLQFEADYSIPIGVGGTARRAAPTLGQLLSQWRVARLRGNDAETVELQLEIELTAPSEESTAGLLLPDWIQWALH